MKPPPMGKEALLVAGPSSRTILRRKKAQANEAANTRWGREMQDKYNVPYTDEQDLAEAGLLTAADHARAVEIYNEELTIRGVSHR